MEYRAGEYLRMQGSSYQKMPFYMTYPMQNVFLEEAEYEKDLDRMKGMYPSEIRDVQKLVEEECDKMEYEGSIMFDEFPDRLMMKKVSERIYQKADGIMRQEGRPDTANLESEELRLEGRRDGFYPPPPPFPPAGYPCRDGLCGLVDVLLYNEMYNRRCRHRRCRLWW